MKFLFWLAAHNPMGKRSLEDVIGIFGKQLRALGHDAIWDPNDDKYIIGPDCYNILVEGFTEKVIELIAAGYQKGARFVCLATEEPTPKGFNHGLDPEMIKRQEIFPKAMKYFEAILHLVPGQHVTDWYSQWCPTAPVELGFAQSLIRPGVQQQLYGLVRPEPPYDFGFYGSLSWRRKKLLNKLASKARTGNKAIRLVNDFTTQDQRDAAMSQAKVIIQIRKFDEMGLVSSSRCNTALMLGRPVVAEPHELSHPWDTVVHFAKSDEAFYTDALMMRKNWLNFHASQFDKFKKVFPPERCIGDALRAVGLVNKSAAA